MAGRAFVSTTWFGFGVASENSESIALDSLPISDASIDQALQWGCPGVFLEPKLGGEFNPGNTRTNVVRAAFQPGKMACKTGKRTARIGRYLNEVRSKSVEAKAVRTENNNLPTYYKLPQAVKIREQALHRLEFRLDLESESSHLRTNAVAFWWLCEVPEQRLNNLGVHHREPFCFY